MSAREEGTWEGLYLDEEGDKESEELEKLGIQGYGISIRKGSEDGFVDDKGTEEFIENL